MDIFILSTRLRICCKSRHAYVLGVDTDCLRLSTGLTILKDPPYLPLSTCLRIWLKPAPRMGYSRIFHVSTNCLQPPTPPLADLFRW